MSRWKRGVATGATANTVLSIVEPVERALLGRTPPTVHAMVWSLAAAAVDGRGRHS